MGGGGVGVKPHRSTPPVGGEQSTQKKSGCGGMRKKVEMGETGCKSKLGGGGQNQTCFITRAVTGPRTHHVPPQVPRKSPKTLF